jgi:predicted RNA binding protein YcfA (HicA-like mRNA interferase family)
MTALPRVSGRQVAKALQKIGYQFDHQRGSHVVLRHASPPYRRLTVPDHDEIAKGTFGLSSDRPASVSRNSKHCCKMQ